MDALFSAVIGELANRSLSFLIDKYSKPPAPSKEESLRRLQLMLLRVRVAVEEAEGRHVRNQPMLLQLNVLREEMYRGYYVLDNFRRQAHKGDEVSVFVSVKIQFWQNSSLSKFNSGKRVRFYTGSRHGKDELEQMLQCVEMTVTGMNEFVIFLKRHCPPMCRQPYSMYMFMEKCMFGRQMEMELVVNFLLDREPPGTDNLGVLPIIGAAKVGKSTLIEHVCFDERVRSHFSRIILFSENDFREEEKPCTLRDGVIKHQRACPDEERLLVVIDLAGDVDEDAWRKLYSASRGCFSPGSKIIIASQSEEVTKFGTAQPLRLRFLSREAHWYYFRVLAFGSSNPEDQPKLASMAVEIFDEYFEQEKSQEFTGPFIHAIALAYTLRASGDARQWRRVLECLRKNEHHKDQKNQLLLRCSNHLGVKKILGLLPRIYGSSLYCEIYGQGRVVHAHEEAPKITPEEILSGSVTPQPHGKFEIVFWKSHLPPYYSYIYSCEIHESKCVIAGNRHCRRGRL